MTGDWGTATWWHFHSSKTKEEGEVRSRGENVSFRSAEFEVRGYSGRGTHEAAGERCLFLGEGLGSYPQKGGN